MSSERKKRSYILKGIIWLICTVALFVASIALLSEVPFLSCIFFILGIINLGLLYIYYRLKNGMFQDFEKEEASQRKKQEEAELIAAGKWDFPSLLFYKKCAKLGIDSKALENSYSKAKCKIIADELMSKASIPERYRPLYSTDARLMEYYHLGEALNEQENTRKAAERLEYQQTAHDAKLTDQQRATLNFYTILRAKNGTDKRKEMLTDLKDKISEKISEIKTAQENMKKLGIIMAQSGYQTKPVDTAVAAGLAYGLGGTGAALYATADAMGRNAQIEAENRRNREAVNQMAVGMCNSSFELSSDIATLERQLEPYQNALKKLHTKVVIPGTDTQELFNSLEIGKTVVEKLKSGALSVKTSLKTSYRPDVPANVKTTVDGTLTGKVYAGDLYVGECVLPLPLYGVECGNPAPTEVESLCGRFAANNKPYRVEFSPNKLWVMEL